MPREITSNCRLVLVTAALIAGFPLYLWQTTNEIPVGTSTVQSSKDTSLDTQFSSEYASRAEQDGRRYRFPSVADRVKIYMGRWYAPPCQESDKVAFRFVNETRGEKFGTFLLIRELPHIDSPERQRIFVATKNIQNRRVFYLDRRELENCTSQRTRNYCSDTQEYMLPALDRLKANSTFATDIPILLQYVHFAKVAALKHINLT